MSTNGDTSSISNVGNKATADNARTFNNGNGTPTGLIKDASQKIHKEIGNSIWNVVGEDVRERQPILRGEYRNERSCVRDTQ